jgi:hypothetical protein
MIYGVVFLALAVQLVALGALLGGWGLMFLWPGVSFALVALGYLGAGPRVFGKRVDGTRHPIATVLLLPYLVFVYAVWWGVCRLSREPVRHEVVPRLFLGRRVSPRELPAGCELVIDLTCEFEAAPAIRRRTGYAGLPTLDAGIPDLDQFRVVVSRAAACPGVVFVHCAQGHGRSGLFAAAVLVARGLAADPRQAVRMVRAVRPWVRLKPHQMRFLTAYARGMAPGLGSTPGRD